MFTLTTRILAAAVSLAAGLYLVTLHEDRGARSARWFLGLGYLMNAAMWIVAAAIHPLETHEGALAISAVARGLFVWVAVGTILLVRQRRLLMRWARDWTMR